MHHDGGNDMLRSLTLHFLLNDIFMVGARGQTNHTGCIIS